MASHMIRGRQLSRDTEHRKALRKNLVQSLFEHGKVRTTVAKAKEVRAFAEKLITLAREDSVNNRRRVTQLMGNRRLVDEEQEWIKNESGSHRKIVQRLFEDVAPKFGDRTSGYTRIIKLSEVRIGDGGDVVLLQLLTEESAPKGTARRSAGLRRKRNEKRHQFAKDVLKKSKGDGEKPAAAPAGEKSEEPASEEKAAE